MTSLPDDLHALAAQPPAVGDWPALVGARVRARRRRRTALTATAGVALLAASGAGVVWATGGDRDTSTLRYASPTPVPSASGLASPTGEPVPSSTAAPAPTPSAMVSPAATTAPGQAVPSTEPSAAPRETPRETAQPQPPRNVITISFSVSPARPRVGEEVTITVVARGDKAKPYFSEIRYGYGQQRRNFPAFSCAEPQPEPAAPGETRDQFTYVYEEAGTDRITAYATSGCSYYEGGAGGSRDVIVDESAQPSATPSGAGVGGELNRSQAP